MSDSGDEALRRDTAADCTHFLPNYLHLSLIIYKDCGLRSVDMSMICRPAACHLGTKELSSLLKRGED